VPAPATVARLPEAAGRRIAGGRLAWSSGQAVRDDVALRRLGFSPVGVVTGSVNSWGVALPPRSTRKRAGLTPPGGQWQPTSLDDPVTARRHGGYVHDWRVGTHDRAARHIGWSWELVVHEQRELHLVDLVLADLLHEARALGAHGVVGVGLRTRHLGTERGSEYPVLEVSATGTAVAVPGVPAVDEPFTTGLSGAELLKLAGAGWAPVRLAVGVGHLRGAARRGSRRALLAVRNAEVRQLSELREMSMAIGVASLEHRAPPPSELVVGVERTVTERRFEVHTRLVGSAVRRCLPVAPAGTLGVLRVVDLSR
ncbi:MAG: heavy metal-binding domain-containing protein, partial [Acidimicrobiales bacterium]